MKTKTELYNFRASSDLIKDLKKASKRLDVPASQIIREAVKDKLKELKDAKKALDI